MVYLTTDLFRLLASFAVAVYVALHYLYSQDGSAFISILQTALLAIVFDWLAFVLVLPKNLPPGPFPLPFIGSAYFFIGKEMHVALDQLRERYGDLVMIYLGHSIGTIYTLSYETTNIIFNAGVNRAYLRQRPELYKSMRGNNFHGVFWLDDAKESSKRRTLTTKLTNELLISQSSILEEVKADFIKVVEQNLGKPMAPPYYDYTGGYIYKMATGRAVDDEAREMFRVILRLYYDSPFYYMFLGHLRLLSYIVPLGKISETLGIENQIHHLLTKLVKKEMEDRQDVLTFSDAGEFQPTNMVDYYRKCQQQGSPPMPLEDFVSVIVEMLIGGVTSGGPQIGWMLFNLAQYPEEQERLYEEIAENIGATMLLTTQHRQLLPRVEAFVNESMRLSSSSVLMPAHATSHDIEYDGMLIPANTIAGIGAWTISRDERVFSKSNQLIVDRWLKQVDGKVVFNNISKSTPFGCGAHTCIGQAAARHQAILFIASLVQRYTWQLSIPWDRQAERITLLERLPPKFELIFSHRE